TDRARGAGTPDLPRDLCVGTRLSERDRQQRGPHLALEGRSREVQLQGEPFPPPREILPELALGLDEHGMALLFRLDVQPDAIGAIVLPQDRGETFVSRDQRQSADWRLHSFVDVTL